MAARVRRDTDGLLQQEGLDAGIAWAAATISGGVIAYSAGIMTIDTQSSAATDDLDQITGGVEGRLLFLGNANVNRQIVLKHLAGASGNIYMSNQQDLTLADPQVPVMLIYKGSNWVVMNYGLTSIVNDPLDSGDVDPGESVGCVAAGRLRNYIGYVIDQVYAQLPSSKLVVIGILKSALEIVTPVTNMPPVNALAELLTTNPPYGTQANFTTAFTSTEYDYLQCVLDLNQTAPGQFGISDIDNAILDMNARATSAAVVFADILGLITYLGANAALQTDVARASSIDCDICTADWCYEWDFTADDGGFTAGGGYTTWSGGVGWQGGYQDGNSVEVCYITRSFAGTNIEGVEITYSKNAGSGANNVNRLRVRDSGATVLEDLTNTLGSSIAKSATGSGIGNEIYIDINSGTAAATITVESCKIYGTGVNPFGSSNC